MKLIRFSSILLKLKHRKISVNAEIGQYVILKSPIEIGANCVIKNSTINNNSIVHENSVINQTTLGSFCKIASNVSVINTSIGNYTYISENSKISNSSIGKFCSIGSRVIIAGGIHPTNYLSTSPVFYSTSKQNGISFADKNYFNESIPVKIGNDVWIGANVYIADGIEIGDGAIIGSGSVVTKNVEPYTIVGGIPAVEIRKRFSKEKIEAIQKIKWWEWDIQKLKNNIQLFQATDFNLNGIK